MSALATTTPGGELASVSYTREQLELVKRTVCVDSTDDELQMFLHRCAKTGLDPFLRQIYSIKRGGKHVIQVGIDGLRLVAIRTGEADGQDAPLWCGPDGVWKDVWLEKMPPAACKVTVHRKGHAHGYTGLALWSEYGANTSNDLYRKMPSQMLAKVAESNAIRKAFPQELSGVYTAEEMDQADAPAPRRGEAVKQVNSAKPLDQKEFDAVTLRKGWPWLRVLKGLNHTQGTTYAPEATFAQVDQALLADFFAWVSAQPDAAPQTSATDAPPEQ
jgi:phage recombination protein Bet